MGEQSRIKFNPVTKEIEIEGSESFVGTYFDKIQAMLSGTQEAVAKIAVKDIPVEEKAIKEKPIRQKRQSKKAQKVAKEDISAVKGKRGDMSKAVLALILESPEGITTTELEEKTGLKDRQIWAITSYAKKAGKIKQVKRGVYEGV